jgi:hypothetical protein
MGHRIGVVRCRCSELEPGGEVHAGSVPRPCGVLVDRRSRAERPFREPANIRAVPNRLVSADPSHGRADPAIHEVGDGLQEAPRVRTASPQVHFQRLIRTRREE